MLERDEYTRLSALVPFHRDADLNTPKGDPAAAENPAASVAHLTVLCLPPPGMRSSEGDPHHRAIKRGKAEPAGLVPFVSACI